MPTELATWLTRSLTVVTDAGTWSVDLNTSAIIGGEIGETTFVFDLDYNRHGDLGDPGTTDDDIVTLAPGNGFVHPLLYKWDLSAVTGTVISASIDVQPNWAEGGKSFYLYEVDRDWTNTTVTYRDLVRLMGDTNLDRTVSPADYTAVTTNWNQAGGWAQGDFNGDGQVSPADYVILTTNWGTDLTWPDPNAPPAPEPATMALLALGGAALLRRKRR